MRRGLLTPSLRRSKLHNWGLKLSLALVFVVSVIVQFGFPTTSGANASPAPTSLSTSLTGGIQKGADISVPAGWPVTDAATLSGPYASRARGTVTYTVFSDPSCSVAVGTGGTVKVRHGKIGASSSVVLTGIGTYYWQALYSGDAKNAASVSNCGTAGEIETTTPPYADRFVNSAIAVVAGTSVSLHWSTPLAATDPAPGAYFHLTSVGASALPNFDSIITWPGNTTDSWSSVDGWWNTDATAMTLAVPSNAVPGATYQVQIYTCSSVSQSCSNSPGAPGPGDEQVSLTISTGWTTIPYTQDFRVSKEFVEPRGSPLDVTFLPDGSLWNTREFSNSLSEIPVATSAARWFSDLSNSRSKPFALCFTECQRSATSALSERVLSADGRIWFTQGGWYDPTSSQPPIPNNHSEIVSFDPATDKFCTYLVPGNDNEVIGLASTGASPNGSIWFTESLGDGTQFPRQPTLDSFNPAQIGDGCSGRSNELFALPNTIESVLLPQNSVPAQIAVDPNGSTLWVTAYGTPEIFEVDTSVNPPRVTSYALNGLNSGTLAQEGYGWQIVVDTNYVYATEYGDSDLVRINKNTGQIDVVPIPLTSDTEEAYGLAVSGNKLFFTLADDDAPSYQAVSAFGYVNIAAWEAASAPCLTVPGDCAPVPSDAVVYSGLSEFVAPKATPADFRGIAVGPDGTIAIADLHKVIKLSP
jgi:hypothetical protein